MHLFLMRHAKTEQQSSNQLDIERNLTLEGKEQANRAAKFLQNYKIDKVLLSNSNRTKQTFSVINNILNIPEVEILSELYKASEEDIIKLLSTQNDEYKNILLIGHNPTIYNTAMIIANHENSKYDDLISTGMPPAKIIVIECHKISHWNAINSSCGNISVIFSPED